MRGLLPRRLGRASRLLAVLSRPSGLAAALVAPGVMSYTAVLMADTATPSWHDGYREMPFVFVGSAAAASGGLGLLAAPLEENAPARAFALGGVVLETLAEHQMESSMGLTAEPLHQGRAGRYLRASRALSLVGGLGVLFAGRDRRIAAASGASLLASSWCTRFAIFHAGQESARDPKYTVVPQRERMAAAARS